MAHDYTIDELADLLTSQILQEQFISKESIRPKVKAFIKAFVNLKNMPQNYNKLVSKTKDANRLRAVEKEHEEAVYWKNLVRLIDPDNMQTHYENCKKTLINKGFYQ